jgi:hypothetical protein
LETTSCELNAVSGKQKGVREKVGRYFRWDYCAADPSEPRATIHYAIHILALLKPAILGWLVG